MPRHAILSLSPTHMLSLCDYYQSSSVLYSLYSDTVAVEGM